MIEDIVTYLKGVDTPTLCNAIELLGVRKHEEGFTPLAIRCLFPELGRMVGYAVTAQVETVTQMEPRDNHLFLHLYALVQQSLKPAVVVLQEIGGHGDYAAHAGEVMCTIFQRLGAVGLVSDCGVRDIPEVRKLGFHYFARGTVASHANFRIARVGLPVQIGAVVIQPGDLLHGDENGLTVVPVEKRDHLPAMVERVRNREGALLDYVRSDEFNLEGLRKHVLE
ncbi:MAG: RraA family protein [Bryobacteraceae bacterium]|nr:RraA family protein [Bryobacteraceae bacterium]MDW8378722.1 RraA family protein [Bryobacterales bacterium]